ncbi:MAG: biopolymer transporter ExbD [Verrucomicrobia bacterium]|nr:biopolymer transporter ExbD [Verrucomicrobiota bacterium]
MAGGGGGGDGEPEFQVAPMIDVLLVLLIFFMSITSAQVLKVDKSIKLPVATHGIKRDDKAMAGLINISWDATTGQAKYKLDDRELDPNDKEGIARELTARKGSNEKYRLLIRADRQCHAKYISKALEWGAEAGIDNIAFSGLNREE